MAKEIDDMNPIMIENILRTKESDRVIESHSIFIEKNACLIKLEDVKIVWSNVRGSYELIQS